MYIYIYIYIYIYVCVCVCVCVCVQSYIYTIIQERCCQLFDFTLCMYMDEACTSRSRFGVLGRVIRILVVTIAAYAN